MKVNISSPITKIFALIRFIFIKFYFRKNLSINKLSFIGQHFKLFIKKNAKIVIKGKIHISDNVELQSRGILSFGNSCAINSFSRIIAFKEISVGNRVLIAQHVSILDHDHKFEIIDGNIKITGFNVESIKIGNNVWLSDKVTITKGVTIGNNVIIAANSVVTKDIPSNSLAGGIPARVIKTLFNN